MGISQYRKKISKTRINASNHVVEGTEHKTYEQIGTEGEWIIYNILVQLFGADMVFRNVYVERSSGRLTEIDLIAVHATGIFVVESKNYSGYVKGSGYEDNWLHIKSGGKQVWFYSPVKQNAGHIDALRKACCIHLGFTPPMLSLLVFSNKCDMHVTQLPQGLRCCNVGQLPALVPQVVGAVAPVLNREQKEGLMQLFYWSQRQFLSPGIIEKHKKDVYAARRWAGKG